jgi:hypothetical protein
MDDEILYLLSIADLWHEYATDQHNSVYSWCLN